MPNASTVLDRFVICATGRFSLEEVAMMGFGHRHEDHFDGVMRLAFCLDGDGHEQHGAVEVRADPEGVGCTAIAGATETLQAARWPGCCRSITTAPCSTRSAAATP